MAGEEGHLVERAIPHNLPIKGGPLDERIEFSTSLQTAAEPKQTFQ
jgi:hypothetical protein